MEFDPKDHDIVSLLTKLKNTSGGYPSRLLASRRQTYLKQVANIGLGIGIGAAYKSHTKTGTGTAGAPVAAGKLIETALVIAIVAQAGAAAYIYRDKLRDVIQSFSSSPRVEEVTSPPVITSPLPQSPITVLETETPVASETPIDTPTTGTPAPSAVSETSQAEGNNQIASTPNPNVDNGNHFGQTPKPDRTKRPDRDPKPKRTPRK
jgi:hypothetical protein